MQIFFCILILIYVIIIFCKLGQVHFEADLKELDELHKRIQAINEDLKKDIERYKRQLRIY